MAKNLGIEQTQGYFVVLDKEEGRKMQETMKVNTGRAGVFYKKEELLSTIKANTALQDREMLLVEITVSQKNMINPNGKKFGIKCGEGIPIRKIESFADAAKEFERQA